MTNKELLKALIAEIDFIMHDKDYRFPESKDTWYSRESCKVLTPEEVFEELRTELTQLNNETNNEIAELQKKLKEKENNELKIIGEKDHLNDLLEDRRKENRILIKAEEQLLQQLKSQPKEIVKKIRKWGQKHYNWVGDGTGYDGQDYNECIGFNMAIDQLNEVLDTILKEYETGEIGG